ncbi:MAG TPA: GGDEF domain-containing protein, partial [Acidimicrobiales bacterium]|nr:GGDEF domain-containing protein [Acidimicrobiales bacterium]
TFAFGFATYRSRKERSERRLEEELAQRSQVDSLTGCLNHGAFYRRLDTEISRALRHDESVSVFMIDVDLFKAFNDANGHVAGDRALAMVAARLIAMCRDFDVVGRVGGDEFAMILPATSLGDASTIAERVVGRLHHPDGIEITASVGYASLDPDEPTAIRLVRDADSGLYQAKMDGRDRAATRELRSTA